MHIFVNKFDKIFEIIYFNFLYYGDTVMDISQLSSREVLTLLIACISVFGFIVTVWIIAHYVSKKEEILLMILEQKLLLLRIFTILFIIWATTSLALIGALNEVVSAIFASIAGFVLGGIKSDGKR